MFKIILLSLLALVIVAVIGVFAVFYKLDLTREDLAEYVSDSSRFIDLPNGANMHFHDEGNPDGPALVLIHGGFGSLQNWEGWVENLSGDYRPIRYEGNQEAQILMFRQGLYMVQQIGPQDLLPRLTELNMPSLVMQGRQDMLVPMRVAGAFRDNFPNAELVVIEDAGHMPMMEKPKETAQAARDFMDANRIGQD